MLPYKNIINIVAQAKPSMTWDGKEDVREWQKNAKARLRELVGLDRMIPAEKDVHIEFDRQEENFREIRFLFQSEPGYYVPCHLLIPDGIKKPVPCIICMQGHSRGMHISLGRTKYEGEAINGDRDFCIRAVKEGFCAIALEQRYFGENSSNDDHRPSCWEPTLTNYLIGRTAIGERVWDVGRCIDTIEDKFTEFIDTKQLYVLGNSGGGTCSVYCAALEDRLMGAVPSCAVSTFAASIGAMRHCACNYVPNILLYFDMGDLLAMAAPKQVVVVSGREDSIFPIDGAKEMVAVGKKFYKAYGVEDNIAHAIGDEGHRFYADIAWDALKKMRKE